MTETPVPRLILSLAVPTIISMMVTNLYNTADTWFVSRLGTSAAGAVSIVFSLGDLSGDRLHVRPRSGQQHIT